MKKKAIKKDFIIEVKNSFNRYISILLIVALGVAFFSGIRAAKPDMKITADHYYDTTNLMDIRIISTLGLTTEDVLAIKDLNGVKNIEPSYSIDVLHNSDDIEMVLKVMSLTENINQINLKTGRLPSKPSECLVDEQFFVNGNYQLGDTIELKSGNDEKLQTSLHQVKFTIVGTGTSPFYLSFDRGNTSIGNGKINGFIIIPKEAFNMEAYTEIYVTTEGSKELLSYTKQYEDAILKVTNNIKGIADNRNEIRYLKVLEEPKAKIEEAKRNLSKSEVEVKNELEQAAIKISDGKEEITEGELALEEAKEKLEKGKIELEQNKNELRKTEDDLKKGENELTSAEKELNNGKKLLADKKKEYETGVELLSNGYLEWEKSLSQWNSTKVELEKNETALNKGLDEILKQKAQLEAIKDMHQNEWQALLDTENTLLKQQEEINNGKTKLESGKLELDDAKKELDSKKASLDEAEIILNEEENKIKNAESTLVEKREELQKGKVLIAKALEEISKGETSLTEAESLLHEEASRLQEGKETLVKSEKEYEDAKKTAEKEILDAKKKIMDGEEELNQVEYPKWYVLDRNSIQTYVEYGQDAERIGNIGEVFPAIFFLVAALVSLTTMTRMVEEQRTGIGTYKALGYSNLSISGKYISYAFSASLLGSVLGVLIGEQLLPKVIITAYKILYRNLPKAITPYNMYYGVLSTVIAVLTTTLAAYLSCYKELMAAPAILMRPEAPKLGKRVILERIPILWNRFNFTAKSTARNLLRYKKRFFMTVFGIGGCMALLLVGFGLKDSISAMSDIQYVELWKQDAIISFKEKVDDSKRKELLEFINTDKRITDSTLIREKTVDVGYMDVYKSTVLIVPEDITQINKFINLRNRITHESYHIKEDGAVITEKLASLLNVRVGNTINIKDGDENIVPVRVTDITENYMLHYIFISPETYEKLYHESPKFNRIYVKSNNNINLNEEGFGEDILDLPNTESILFTAELQERISDMLDSLNLVIYVLIISAGLLAFIVLYNLNNININERKRELATLKVLGFGDTEVATYVYRENIILTLIGVFVGIFLGLILHRFVILTAEIDTFMFGRNMRFLSYLYSGLITFGFSAFVNLVMYMKLQKIDMVESLKSVE